VALLFPLLFACEEKDEDEVECDVGCEDFAECECEVEYADYWCVVSWCEGVCEDGGTVLDVASYAYNSLEDLETAVDMCRGEQETDPERPLDATAFTCDCAEVF
jgi:hypothetical protein